MCQIAEPAGLAGPPKASMALATCSRAVAVRSVSVSRVAAGTRMRGVARSRLKAAARKAPRKASPAACIAGADGAAGEHQAEGVDGAAPEDGEAGFWVCFADGWGEVAVLEAPA